jgi:hypothetical protein
MRGWKSEALSPHRSSGGLASSNISSPLFTRISSSTCASVIHNVRHDAARTLLPFCGPIQLQYLRIGSGHIATENLGSSGATFLPNHMGRCSTPNELVIISSFQGQKLFRSSYIKMQGKKVFPQGQGAFQLGLFLSL